MNSTTKLELLAPAGSPEALDAAIGEGADAVYLGLKDFNARARAKNFSYKQFESIVEKLHSIQKKIYVTVNTVFEERETQMMYNFLKYLAAVKPDSIIVQDTGVLQFASMYFPDLPLHASTQMNISSSEGINLLSKFNVKRVVLSRELDFEQIKEIRKNTGSELELFAHGALCVSVSGACLFSSFFGGKSANRGRCTQACRRMYKTESSPNDGKYLFSLNDLSLLKHIPEISESGINSLKLEGRMKSYQYIATIVKAFRLMIDGYATDRERVYLQAKEIMEHDFARKKTEYLFVTPHNPDIISSDRSGQTGIFSGYIQSVTPNTDSIDIVLDRNSDIESGDTIRIQSSDDKWRISVRVNSRSDKTISFPLPKEEHHISKSSEVFIISKKEFTKGYPRIIPATLDKYKKHPSITPLKPLDKIQVKPLIKLNDGFYVKINKSSDLHIIQSDRPEKVIFHLTRYNLDELFSNLSKTQFNPEDIILYLEPYFDFNNQTFLTDNIQKIIAKGFQHIIFNNLGQLNILKRHNLNLIAGPYAYTFNSYAVRFFQNFSIKYIVSPYENSRKNLLLTSENSPAADFFITLFNYPELFQIIPELPGLSHDTVLTDTHNQYQFYVNTSKTKTSVMPEKPFSITDKLLELKSKGFKKFIIDLSYTKLNKSVYKKIMKAARSGEHMEQTERFNWKEGFYFDTEKNTDKVE